MQIGGAWQINRWESGTFEKREHDCKIHALTASDCGQQRRHDYAQQPGCVASGSIFVGTVVVPWLNTGVSSP